MRSVETYVAGAKRRQFMPLYSIAYVSTALALPSPRSVYFWKNGKVVTEKP
jgi:hypothetical protein